MKTQIKDIVIGIFTVIGFTAVVMGFTNQTEPQQTYGTPESHVWEAQINAEGMKVVKFLHNKKTGEVIQWTDSKFKQVVPPQTN